MSGTDSVNLKLLLKKLSKKKIKTILVEGGGTVNWEFVKQELFDEMIPWNPCDMFFYQRALIDEKI
ncbi:MAG: dihydrofolate reductase family protein [Flavobacteriaceae bacterium]